MNTKRGAAGANTSNTPRGMNSKGPGVKRARPAAEHPPEHPPDAPAAAVDHNAGLDAADPPPRKPCACNAVGCVECYERKHPSAEGEALARIEATVADPATVTSSAPDGITVHAGDDAVKVAASVRAKVAREAREAREARDAAVPASGDRRAPGARGRRAEDRAEQESAAPEGGAPAFACTDLGNAERLAFQHGGDLRWCEAWGAWVVWGGDRWARDDTGEVMRRAALTVRSIGAEAAACDDSRARKDLWAHALKSESARALGAMVQLTRSRPGMSARPADFDGDPMLLNCRNGVVDLRTGELLPHRREHMHARSTGVNYDPAAKSPTWERFLRENLDGDAELIAELQRFAGYCLTGDTREDALYFLSGGGGSGKSTFIESLRCALGSYADTINFDVLLKQPHGRRELSPELASLPGVRFVVAIESDRGREFDTGYIKKLTGGDVLQAEAKYQAPFSYRPQFKLCLASNYDPGADSGDSGFWRRVRRVIFPHSRPLGAPRDTSIRRDLTDPATSGAAVLAWAVQGCLAWQRDGLPESAAVAASRVAYQRANDPLAEFIAARVMVNKLATVPRREMLGAYESWSTATGAESLGARRFAELMRERIREKHGADFKPDGTGRAANYKSPVDIWRGVRLYTAQEMEERSRRAERGAAEGDGCRDIVGRFDGVSPEVSHARQPKETFGGNAPEVPTTSLQGEGDPSRVRAVFRA